jgi:CheY-like chemotaxis protein
MKKVLLASESNLFLKRNTTLLQNRGLRLFTATSGAKALELHHEHIFDLIFADWALEDMDGCMLCSLIRREENLHHVPVILLFYSTLESIEKVQQSGASSMLLKPVEPMQILETISQFIDIQIGKSKRVELNVKVQSKILGLEFFCVSHDISNTGILLETKNHLDIGNRIICQFELLSSCQVETEGEVIRSLSTLEGITLYGVKFIDLSFSYRRAINNYVAAYTQSVGGVTFPHANETTSAGYQRV